jgi:GTP-binding protein Era
MPQWGAPPPPVPHLTARALLRFLRREQYDIACNWKVYVDIVISRESHKSIVIGRAGSMIKLIGSTARTELESTWGPGQLFLNVVVDDSWTQDSEKISAICSNISL